LSDEVLRRFTKGRELIAQVATLDPERAAETIIHSCYYAMYHGAMAVLIARFGTAPAKHSSLIGQFGLLLKPMGEAERQAGRLLRAAFDLRLVADYEVEPAIMSSEAKRVLDAAPGFLDFCESLTRL
jgi:uncharacterized protein (UPF0332 family)